MCNAFKFESKIIKGNSASLGQFPYFAHLVFTTDDGDTTGCSGSLLSDYFVISAAHCTIDSTYALVYLGYLKRDCDDECQQYTVLKKNFHVHPDFIAKKVINDITLLRLPKKAIFTPTVQPIKLSFQPFGEKIEVIAVGSGATKPNATEIAPILQYARLITVSNKICSLTYPVLKKEPHKHDVICAWSSAQSSIYRGDSGGPLVQKTDGSLFAIANFGHPRGIVQAVPQAFTFIPFHLDWIKKITNPK